jgi:hypothetical protein
MTNNLSDDIRALIAAEKPDVIGATANPLSI